MWIFYRYLRKAPSLFTIFQKNNCYRSTTLLFGLGQTIKAAADGYSATQEQSTSCYGSKGWAFESVLISQDESSVNDDDDDHDSDHHHHHHHHHNHHHHDMNDNDNVGDDTDPFQKNGSFSFLSDSCFKIGQGFILNVSLGIHL